MNKLIFILIIITVFFTSCNEDKYSDVSKFDIELFENKYKLWVEQEYMDYSIKQTTGGFSSGPITITLYVKDGIFVYFTNDALDTSKVLPADDRDVMFSNHKSISDLYAYIYDEINKSGNQQLNIEIEYNDEFNFPSYVRVQKGLSYQNDNFKISQD